jgi:hypothetical protein
LNGGMNTESQIVRLWKAAVMHQPAVLFRHLPGRIEEIHKEAATIACLYTEIWTRNLLNVKHKCSSLDCARAIQACSLLQHPISQSILIARNIGRQTVFCNSRPFYDNWCGINYCR